MNEQLTGSVEQKDAGHEDLELFVLRAARARGERRAECTRLRAELRASRTSGERE